MIRFSYQLLMFIMGLCITKEVFGQIHSQKFQIVEDVRAQKLSMDQAYLIMSNMNNSNTIIVLGNPLICEACDLEKMAEVSSHSNVTLIISTQYAYDLEVRSLSSNGFQLCYLTSYKFDEHGTYLFKVTQEAEISTEACSIVQIEESSHYWSPIIIGFVVWIASIAIIQLCCQIYHSDYFNKIIGNVSNQRLIKGKYETIPLMEPFSSQGEGNKKTVHLTSNDETSPLVESSDLLNKTTTNSNSIKPKRFQALDSFRGFALMLMIFVDYGAGGYWFFRHAVWNGFNLADLPFPWFIWLIGFSIVLSQKSFHKKKVRKRYILFKISRRTVMLFLLGLTGNNNTPHLEDLRIFDVLQRLALCYFFTALIVLFVSNSNDESNTIRSTNDGKMNQHWRIDLLNSVLHFWLQWLCVLLIITTWLLITFFLNVPNCPKGYLGPGGKHEYGKYQNCTGGADRYIDELILTEAHMERRGPYSDIYGSQLAFEPEGLLSTLMTIVLCYLGVQAAHSYVHCTSVRHVCIHWFVSAIICGFIGLLLSKGGQFNQWIPLNKNLWSLSFILIVASLSYIILIIFYLVFDIRQWLTSGPFVWLGMNSIFIYMAHNVFHHTFPITFHVEQTHAKMMAVNLYGVFFWTLFAGLMYWKKIFIVI